ncbi:unnamed protein product [Linum trigynum]|uniref:Uncharacterized protein n=1 Tax=Linum trigynum TaxID=586398 RepID=A0AAV2GAI9_9ROSI
MWVLRGFLARAEDSGEWFLFADHNGRAGHINRPCLGCTGRGARPCNAGFGPCSRHGLAEERRTTVPLAHMAVPSLPRARTAKGGYPHGHARHHGARARRTVRPGRAHGRAISAFGRALLAESSHGQGGFPHGRASCGPGRATCWSPEINLFSLKNDT